MNLNLKNVLIVSGLILALVAATVFVVNYNNSNCEVQPECLDSLGNSVDTLVVDSVPVDVDTLVLQ